MKRWLLSLFSLLALEGSFFCQADDSAVRHLALAARHEQWLAEVQFRASYQFQYGFAESLDAARRGEFSRLDEWSDGVPHTAIGVLVKSPEYVRYSCKYTGLPLVVGPDTVTRVSYDEIRSLSRSFRYRASDPILRPSVLAGREIDDSEFGSPYAAGVSSKDCVSPLSIWGGPPSAAFMSGPEGADVEFRYAELDSDRVKATLVAVSPGRKETREMVFRMDLSSPVLESIESVTERDGRSEPKWRCGYATDFVECTGGPVPSRVTKVQYGITVPPMWVVTTWESADLATPASFDDQFVVAMEAKTQLTGLPGIAPRTEAVNLDVSKLGPEVFERPLVAGPMHVSDSVGLREILFAVPVLIAGMVVLVRYLAKRKAAP